LILLKTFKDKDERHPAEIQPVVTMLKNILQENINFRRLTLVGCKMKIYQERMRMSSFLNVIASIKNDNGDFNKKETKKAIQAS